MSLHAATIERLDATTTTDSDLVRRALAGREDGFEELVRRYQRPIASYVYRLVGNYEAALDLTQDVFIKVYSSLDRYQPQYKFSTWIYKIAHNAAIDHLRRITARDHVVAKQGTQNNGEEREVQIASYAPSPEQESEKAEQRAEIETVVQSLPTGYRELIILRHAHDLNYDEIAEVTNLPLGTVKNRIFRAREMMRQRLTERGITTTTTTTNATGV